MYLFDNTTLNEYFTNTTATSSMAGLNSLLTVHISDCFLGHFAVPVCYITN